MAISWKKWRVQLRVALGALALWPAVSWASGSCADGFQELTQPGGATFYQATATYDALDVRQALDGYREVAVAQGYLIVREPDYGGKMPTLAIGKPPSPNPVVIMVDPQSYAISVVSIVGPGHHVEPADERARVCGLVDRYEAYRRNASSETSRDQAVAQAQLESRTTIPEKITSLRLLSPSVPFDLAAAKAALEPGHSIIKGQACANYSGTLILASGSKVYLFPATPYLEEFIALAKKAKPGKDKLVPDPAAFSTRMEATADREGRFQFSRMKPGRYFLLTTVSAELSGSRDVYAGHVEDGYGSASVYARQDYSFGASNELTKFINVHDDGDSVKVTLQPRITANPFHTGLSGSVFGCHKLP